MLNNLSALTPPFLMAAAFLIAAGAFVRHEMRAGKNRTEDDAATESRLDSAPEAEEDAADQRSVQSSVHDKPDDGSQD
ncbi:MAG: hypothetical protein ACR2FU_08565 [Streptosporangiaceae bacterium]